MRPLCICGQRPAAINYSKNGKTYYRKKCESCNKYGTVGKGIPQWKLDGYEKKDTWFAGKVVKAKKEATPQRDQTIVTQTVDDDEIPF